ncbi:MAG: CBS domain-containing protein [Thermoleophilia bacterium]
MSESIDLSGLTAGDIMQKDVVTIREEATMQELAELLSVNRISGVPVIDEMNRVVGIATEGDLVAIDAEIHFPHYIQFLDSVIFLESVKKFDERLRRAAAYRVREIMTTEVVSVQQDEPLERVATLMTDNEINRLPVLNGDVLAGIVTRADVVRAMSQS